MGNKQSEQSQRKKFYQIKLVDIDYKVALEGLQFQQSVYNIESGRFKVNAHVDKNIRDSEFCHQEIKPLTSVSEDIIRLYLDSMSNFKGLYVKINKEWRVTRYKQGGHFVEHHDRQKQRQGYSHYGTEILLPPRNQISYKGGELRIIHNCEQIEIVPHQQKWTHIIMQLGVRHQVKRVTKGTRISYIKQIWVEEHGNEYHQTDQDLERKQKQRFRLIERQREQQERMRTFRQRQVYGGRQGYVD